MSDPKPFVGVVGGSARAAAHSLYRAGYPAWAVDLFTDRDLLAASARCPFDEYPRGMPALTTEFVPGPVVYTGGLENHPDVVADLAARRPLWGNPPAVLERVRDPLFPGEVWESDDGDALRVPQVLVEGNSPAEGMWLWKLRRGAGGDGVHAANGGGTVILPDFYLQEFIAGRPMSALFVAGQSTTLLGVTEQLVGESWLHARRFAWAGNVGPVELPEATADALARFGAALAWTGGLVGLFGVDFILDNKNVAWPVEVNPRYTGSVEVIEHATGRAVMLDHAAAFGAGGSRYCAAPTRADVATPPPAPPPEGEGCSRLEPSCDSAPAHETPGQSVGASPPFPLREGGPGGLGGSGLHALRRNPRHRVVGKAVYYAPSPIRFPAAGPWDDWDRPFDAWNLPAFADVPAAGSAIEPGWPVFTLFEAGSSPAAVRARLQSRAAELDRLFDEDESP